MSGQSLLPAPLPRLLYRRAPAGSRDRIDKDAALTFVLAKIADHLPVIKSILQKRTVRHARWFTRTKIS
jgi:hypothetical protein